MSIETLDALLAAATPVPWSRINPGIAFGTNDGALARAAVNALPALLAVAKAAIDVRETRMAYSTALPRGVDCRTEELAFDAARRALDVALDALNGDRGETVSL